MQNQENMHTENEINVINAINSTDTINDAVDVVQTAAAESVAAEEVVDAIAKNAKVIADLEAKVAELQDAFMRAKADGENIRRRAQEDISKAHKFAIEGFAEATAGAGL